MRVDFFAEWIPTLFVGPACARLGYGFGYGCGYVYGYGRVVRTGLTVMRGMGMDMDMGVGMYVWGGSARSLASLILYCGFGVDFARPVVARLRGWGDGASRHVHGYGYGCMYG